jgi:carbon-monoxide dehydrogenase large subunit
VTQEFEHRPATAARGGVGEAPTRKEDHRLVTGSGRFVADIALPGTRDVAFLRSPHAHATIRAIDVSPALASEGVLHAFDGRRADFRDVELVALSGLPGFVATPVPPLAHDKVRYAGEPVAAVVADSRALAEDAIEAIAIEYEVLPANVRAGEPADVAVHDGAPDNVLLQREFIAGDVDAALDRAEVVVERRLTTNRHAGNPLECRAGIALFESGSRRLTFYCGTQIPHLVRNKLAELVDLPEGDIRVVAPDVGGGFGVKAVLYAEDVALCLMAMALPDTPLRWIEDRAEHLLAAAHARDHQYVLRGGFAADGELLALDADITVNVGAYSLYPWTAGIEPLMAGGLLTGPYRLEHYRCVTRGVATNSAPVGPYRGVARPATVFAMEALMDEAARRLRVSAEAIRRRNLISRADVPYTLPTRVVDDSGNYAACLDKALAMFDVAAFRAEQARRQVFDEPPIGMGIAVYNELTGLGRRSPAGPRMAFRTGHDACTVRVDPDGKLSVLSGVVGQGQGLETTIAQVVASAVGVDYDDVRVRIGDTDANPWGVGAFSSRQAVIGGGAARMAALDVRDQILSLAAALTERDVPALRIVSGVVLDEDGEEVVTLARVARIAYLETHRLPDGFEPGLEATKYYDPFLGVFAAGAQVGAVELDPATGALKILRWVCVEDPGNVINPQVVDGQVSGAIAQGIGGALYEHLVYDDDGNLSTGTLLDYLMPTAAEMPELELEHASLPADNPLGVRGVGEGGTLGPNAVLAGAVADAIGVAIDNLPITPERVWEAARCST